jgi:hypothetical protein
MSDSLTEAQWNRLSRSVVNNASASARKEALLEIRKLDHPGLADLLRQVAAEDKDDEVRDLAQNLLNKLEIQQALKSGSFEKSAPPVVPAPEPEPDWLNRDYTSESTPTSIGELLETPRTGAWTCNFCGTENSSGQNCISCGAERSIERYVEDEAPRKRKPDDAAQADFSDVFLLQPSSMAYLLGKASIGAAVNSLSAGCGALFLLPFIAIGVFVVFLAVSEWRNYHILNTTGQITQGLYTGRHYTTDDDDGGTTYYAEYQYEVAGTPYYGSHSVSYELYNRVEKGGGVNILYAPSNPGLARIDGTNDVSMPAFLTLFALLWNGISWGIFGSIIVSHRRDRELARDGQLVRGELVSASGQTGSKGKYYVTARYRFQPPDSGEPIVRNQTALRSDMRNTAMPAAGTPVMVLYKNRKRFKML